MPDDHWTFSLEEAQAKLPEEPAVFRFWYGMRHGTMRVGLYAPTSKDMQGPHRQDELYIIIRGDGDFIRGDQRRRFAAHDVILVEAGVSHRFENFSDDFLTWVVFWGPPGGEAQSGDDSGAAP